MAKRTEEHAPELVAVYPIAEKRALEALRDYARMADQLPLTALLCRVYLQGIRDVVEAQNREEESTDGE